MAPKTLDIVLGHEFVHNDANLMSFLLSKSYNLQVTTDEEKKMFI